MFLIACDPQPETRFCIAIEEGEAWLLGDYQAVEAAYPSVDWNVLRGYRNDEICGTWERLARRIPRWLRSTETVGMAGCREGKGSMG